MTYVDYQDNYKDLVNEYFSSQIKKNLSKDNYVLLLDGQQLRTSSTLIRNKSATTLQIIIVERDENTYRLMRQKNKIEKVSNTIIHDSLENFLGYCDKTVLAEIQAVFFDFMGTVTGSMLTDDYPLETINRFLRNTKQRKIIFACTFSLRSRRGKMKGFKSIISQIKKFLQKNFKYNKFSFENLKIIKYKRGKGMPMIFLMYALTRDYYIIPENISFYVDKRGWIGYRND